MGKGKDTFDVRKWISENKHNLDEAEYTSDLSGELQQLNYKISEYIKQIGEVGWAMKQVGFDDKEIDKVEKEFNKIVDLHDKTIKRVSRKLDK